MISASEAIESLLWTLERSPKTYEFHRESLVKLRIALVNAELRQQEMEKENVQ